MTRGQNYVRQAAAAREALAEAELNADKVLHACAARAADGFTWCEVAPSRPLDLTATAAVAATLARLAKERVKVEWVKRRDGPEGDFYQVLKISWEDADRDRPRT